MKIKSQIVYPQLGIADEVEEEVLDDNEKEKKDEKDEKKST